MPEQRRATAIGASGRSDPDRAAATRSVGTIGFVALAAVFAGVVIGLAPAEQTMGEGIRIVYLHVALTLAGAVGFAATAFIGLGALVSDSAAAARWTLACHAVALALFAAGTATSVIAAWINWGGLFLDEPLMRSSLVVLAIGVLSYALATWSTRARLRGMLGLGPAVALAWALIGTPVLLHPGAMVLSHSAAPIRWTFVVVTALAVAAGAAVVRWIGSSGGQGARIERPR